MPDWRDAAAYAPLLDADRSLIAWEWLRRDPRYRFAVRHPPAVQGSEAFGLVCFEDPDLAVPAARPLWRAKDHPFVLAVEPSERRSPCDTIDLGRFGALARSIAGASDHLLLSDGFRTIRLDGPPGTFSRSCSLRFCIEGVAAAETQLLTLRRFLALVRHGRFSHSLHPRERRARRWVLLLRAADALAAGASQREIAQVLLGGRAQVTGWRMHEPSLRSQAQRLVRGSRRLAAGGYRRFLLPPQEGYGEPN